MVKSTIIIVGGGIAGLTTAHHLLHHIRDTSLRIIILEKDDILGGMAKSSRDYMTKVPTEHSWRGYGPFYKNTFELMKQIPFWIYNETVYDQLSKPIKFLYMDISSPINWISKVIVVYNLLKFIVGSDKYRKSLELVSLQEKMVDIGLDSNMIRYVNSTIGPFFGLDAPFASVYHLLRFLELSISLNTIHFHNKYKNSTINRKGYSDRNILHLNKRWHAMTAPTNEAWIDPWTYYLTNQTHNPNVDIEIWPNHKLINIYLSPHNSQIDRLLVENTKNNNLIDIRVDFVVLAIDPYSARDLIVRNPIIALDSELVKVKNLAESCIPNNMISFQIAFARKIYFPSHDNGVIFMDSPYNITLYPQEDFFVKGVYLGDGVKSLWSGTICYDGYGILFPNKRATECNPSQLKHEIWYQITTSTDFQKLIYENNKHHLREITKSIIYFGIWEEWKWDPSRHKMVNGHHKYVDRIGNDSFKPCQKCDNIINLILSGAHTKTTLDVWSMESAVESGILASQVLQNKLS